jgi:hypothetical protein
MALHKRKTTGKAATKRRTKKAAKKRSLSKVQATSLQREAIVAFATVLGRATAPARARAVTGLGTNRRLLDQILGGHYPDSAPLDPPFDGLARAGLAARIRRAGVLVNPAVVINCTIVKCVYTEMNRVNPGGR